MHPSRATFLLVHGAWWGACIWHKLILRLEEAGHQVFAPDVPGAGRNRTPLSAVTLASSVDHIRDLVDRAEEPVILVGHGFGDVIISQVAEERPENIRHRAYLTALLPRNGEAALDAHKFSREKRVREATERTSAFRQSDAHHFPVLESILSCETTIRTNEISES